MIRIRTIAVVGFVIVNSVNAIGVAPSAGQVVPSPTPFRASIPTDAPPVTVGVEESPVPTGTATQEGPPQLEARESGVTINLRAEPDLDSNIVGHLPYGERFTITGRYYRWLQIRFEPSPSRIAYVYDELVNILGDETRIPDLTVLPTADDPAARATETRDAILQVSGGELTLTAEVRVLAGGNAPAGAVGVAEGSDGGAVTAFPTFTYPPNIPGQVPSLMSPMALPPTPGSDPVPVDFTTADGIAPIVPIAVLVALGGIGLILSTLLRK